MLRIITDGAADLPVGWEEEFDFEIVPINIHFGEETFLQYIEMDLDGFYKKVGTSPIFPKTSQPSPHQFAEFYKASVKEGDTILSIHVTSKLSGTYASAVSAAERVLLMGNEAFGNQPVHVGVVHAHDPESAATLMTEVKKRFNYADVVESELSVSLAINLGPDTVGLVL